MRLFVFLSLLLTATLPAYGQQPADPLDRWHATQIAAARRVSAVTCVEQSERRLDSPNGAKQIHTRVRLRAVPGQSHVERSVEQIEMNGRDVPDNERRRIMRYLRPGRHEQERVADMLFVPTAFARELRREGPVRPDPVAGGALRVDLLGAADHPIERLTLWFSERGDRLVRSRLLARRGSDDPPLVVETDYRRRSGLDVPDTRHVQGSMLVRKRSRTYTVLYEQQTAYRDYRFER